MASPAVQTVSAMTPGFTDTHVITLPTGIQDGDLLIAFVCWNALSASTGSTWPGGWVPMDEERDSSAICCDLYYKVAASEGASFTVTTTASMRGACIVYRITGNIDPATQVPEFTQFNNDGDASLNPDPPDLTPTGGSKDYLWLALEGNDNSNTTGYPSGYINTQTINSNGDCNSGSAEKQATADSENPGTFTIDVSQDYVAYTVAVHPPVVLIPVTKLTHAVTFRVT